jgi:hypothetical protein
MIEVFEMTLASVCWALSLYILWGLLPQMRDHAEWHVTGLCFFASFAGYLGCEAIAPSDWLDDHYWIYLVGNSLFPMGAITVLWGYHRKDMV